jgi:adenosylhomocysteine nucleosidase
MRILVTFAVEAEFAPWREARRFRKEGFARGGPDRGSEAVYRGEFERSTVAVGITGIGWRGLPAGLQHLLVEKPEVWISSGLAGALRESARPGEVIAPRTLLSGAANGPEADRLDVDAGLHGLALRCGASEADFLLTTDQVLTRASEKKAQAPRASLVDMESFAAVQEAKRRGARSVVIRAVSDSAHEDLPIDFNRTLTGRSQVSVARVLVELAKNPWAMPSMIRFGMQSRRAADSLAGFLDRYVECLANSESRTASEVAAR